MREIEEERRPTVNHIEAPDDSFAEKFIQQGIREVASVLAKYGVDHETVLTADLPKGSKPTDAQIANTLSQIEVFDDNLKHPDMSTDDGLVQAAIVTEAKRIALAKSTNNRKLKERLEGFGDKVLDNVGGIIARVWGRKGLTTVLAITTLIATACGPGGIIPIVPIVVDEGGNGRPTPTLSAPLPTETKQKPTMTAVVPKFTPTPAATKTPEATATQEAKTYAICPDITKYKDYPIPAEDLLNGDYLKWLDTISQPFDQTKIKTNIAIYDYKSFYTIEYDSYTAPHFLGKNAGKEPFRRTRTCGFTTYKGHDYVVMPVEYFNPQNPAKNAWVIEVLPLTNENGPLIFGSKTNPTTDPTDTLIYWRDQMNISLMLDVNFNAGISNEADPLVQASWAKYPDIQSRISRFVTKAGSFDASKQDPSALSGPLMLAQIIGPASNWYK